MKNTCPVDIGLDGVVIYSLNILFIIFVITVVVSLFWRALVNG
jgi:uncharacterized membrane protein YtjA (UPF0391 family)